MLRVISGFTKNFAVHNHLSEHGDAYLDKCLNSLLDSASFIFSEL